MTEECSQRCYARMTEWENFDEEIRIYEDEKRKVREAMLGLPLSTLRSKFISEMDGLQTDILHWFGSGDCPTEDVSRVLQIIEAMDDVTQMGFTRNAQLWESRKDVFAISVDNVKEIGGRTGLFSVANYEEGMSVMYRNGEPVRGGLCGPELCEDSNDSTLIHFINCKTCKRLDMGCFDKQEGEHG